MITEPQVHLLSAEAYRALPGLNYSGLKDLAISPLRYWYHHINPDRPEREETAEMRIGTAVHCAVLERRDFPDRYCVELSVDDCPGCLTTIDSIREWIRDKGYKPAGSRKADLIEQALSIDPSVDIFDVIAARDAEVNAGKTRLRLADWDRIHGAADALNIEPQIVDMLADGLPEVSLFATDPDSGVPLKARLDWMTPTVTLDLKTFFPHRGVSIDTAVNRAIWYEGYYKQACFYSLVRALAAGKDADAGPQLAPTFVIAFVESDPPHEVRIRSLRPTVGGEVNLYWERARLEIRELIRLYSQCQARWGDRQWRMPRPIEPLVDNDMPQVMYS